MDSKIKPALSQVGESKISRRTVARGAAWSVPVAAVAVSAPAFAASPVCEPELTLDVNNSCKCPGQSQNSNEFAYYLSFCITDANDCGLAEGTEFTIKSIRANPGAKGALTSAACGGFPGFADATGTVGSDGCTEVVRGVGESSANGLDVTFTIAGVQGPNPDGSFTTTAIPAPPNCTGPLATQRCGACAPA